MTSGRAIAAQAGALATVLAVAGCGNSITTEIVGATGAAVGRSGSPELPLAVCSGSVDVIFLYAPTKEMSRRRRSPSVSGARPNR